MSKRLYAGILTILLIQITGSAQEPSHYDWGNFTPADSLRGYLSPLRTCYNVTYYHLDITVDTAGHSIRGSNAIWFKVAFPFDSMQVDLFPNMKVDSILYFAEGVSASDGEDGTPLRYDREFGAVFIHMPHSLAAGSYHRIVFYYSGKPQVANNPPWDGGFIWKHDSEGNPWIMVTCQGTGASLWWPNKDHQTAKPDSMLLSVSVPGSLQDISNGRLRSKVDLPNGMTQYNWFISYPINNYNVTLNIGKYAHFNDAYTSRDGSKLTLDYYVLPGNLHKAKRQFREVKTMLACYEKYFGKYPFYREGYKLIESSHNGMEHQTAVAYGNHYMMGYEGRASSPEGLKFDFIIIHESAHEWWGNSVTSKDLADMWIHESFGAYAEALYVEYNWGHKAALEYINAKRQTVRNDKPMIGPYGVNQEGSGDMYDKGQLVLNTLRDVIDDDTLWFSMLKGFQQEYAYRTVDADDVIQYVNKRTGANYNYFFDQYFRYTNPPEFLAIVSQKGDSTYVRYRWEADVKDFRMPIKVTRSKGKFRFVYPTTYWQRMAVANLDPKYFKVDEDEFYCRVKILRFYTDPNSSIRM